MHSAVHFQQVMDSNMFLQQHRSAALHWRHKAGPARQAGLLQRGNFQRCKQRRVTGSPGVVRASQLPSDEAPVPAVGWLWDKKAAQTRQRLREQNIRPKKSLGQNFLLDEDILQRIVAAAGVQPGDLVLEIGPGTGNLTRYLLAAGAVVTAVEKDYTLHDQLAQEFAEVPALRLVQGDILRVNLQQLMADMQQHWEEQQQQQQTAQGNTSSDGNGSSSSISAARGPRRVKVVANLPYNITKECLLRLLPRSDVLSHLFFMLQDEVAVRLTGLEPGGPDWRVMNLITQYYSTPQYKFQIDRRKYHPAPKVNGAMVDFVLLQPDQRVAVPDERIFLQLLKKAFSQRRKVMRNSLQPLWGSAEVARALEAVGLNPDARAQDLTLEEFVRLAWQLRDSRAAAGQGERRQQQDGSMGEEDGTGDITAGEEDL